jgi:hypothetical protein
VANLLDWNALGFEKLEDLADSISDPAPERFTMKVLCSSAAPEERNVYRNIVQKFEAPVERHRHKRTCRRAAANALVLAFFL